MTKLKRATRTRMTTGRQADGSIGYYSYARNANDIIEQMWIARKGNKTTTREWTGVTYWTVIEANEAMRDLNCQS